MDTWKLQEECVRISWWYRQVRGAQVPPTSKTLYELSTDREELNRCRQPEGFRVPILVRQSDIKNGIPTES